ncbi:hypothetical protein [Halohasta litorea]|uniref:Rpa-associated protein n=1 Tax=Halohasta litorea TaxID=869891 RepID=A0ABD6D9N5_9EURY|nr:hypothetical protein [Halohasta litorea]
MSADGDSGPGRREVAYRPFAAEFDDASLSYSESDEERAPNFVVTPTGLRVNRLFAVGVLTEVESINEDTLRGRIVDPTGAFVTYAGQYQPPAQAFLDRTTPPAFVAITGKARTFEPEDSDRVFTSVRPESLSEVDVSTRDRWVVSAAKSTLQRIAVCAAARDSPLRGEALRAALSEAGVDDSLAAGVPRALDHYGTTTAYLEGLRQLAVDALELVADEREEVRPLNVAPDESGDVELGPLPAVDIDLEEDVSTEPAETAANTADSATDQTDASTEEPTATASDSAEATTADEAASTEATETPTTPDPAESSGTPASESTDSTPTTDPEDDTATTDVEDEAGPETDVSATPDTEVANGASEPDAAAETGDATDNSTDEEAAESGMYQLDEEEREELESEFDTGFSSGNEVDPAGEADIDVPDADELAEQAEAEGTAPEETAADAETADEPLGEFDDGVGDSDEDTGSAEEPATETESTTETDDSPEAGSGADEEPSTEVDLEGAVVETMAELDDGDGVDREALVAELVDEYGVDEAAVEDAIDDALMGGRCYEPADGTLKAI